MSALQHCGREAPAPRRATSPAANEVVLGLDSEGMVCDCNAAGEALFKYPRGKLIGRHVATILPELKGTGLIHDGRPNPRLQFLSHIGHVFTVISCDGQRFASELFFNRVDNSEEARLRLIVRPLWVSRGIR
jgi:PAS domain-containing protein